MTSLLRTLSLLAIFAGAHAIVGCAAGDGDHPTGSITAGFTDGSTYAADGAFTVTLENANVKVVGHLVEPSTGDELDLAIALPEEGGTEREIDVDCDLTLVRSKAKKTVRVHVSARDLVRTEHGVTGHLTLKGESGSPVLAGTIDF